jgi:hypothetical protein
MNVIFNHLKNNQMHHYGMQMVDNINFLPRGAFLTECHVLNGIEYSTEICIPNGMQVLYGIEYSTERCIPDGMQALDIIEYSTERYILTEYYYFVFLQYVVLRLSVKNTCTIVPAFLTKYILKYTKND